MSFLNVEKVCRICVLEKEDMQGMFDMVNCNGVELPISKVLSVFIQEVASNEGPFLPISICSKCTEHAIIAYNFKELCEHSNILFRDYLGSLKESTATNVEESVNNNHIDTRELMKVETGDNYEVLKSDRKRSASSKAIEKIKTIIEYNSDDGLNDYKDCSDFEPEPDTNTSVKSDDELKPPEKVGRKRKLVKSKTKQTDNSNAGQKAMGGTLDGIEKEIGNLHCCDYCDKWFKNKYTLISHRKRHQFKGQFLCNVCGKGYSSQSCLSRHSIVHTGEKKFECKVCHKRFPSAYNLSLHSRTHSGLKPYLCTVCGKKFRHPTGLTYHMRTHTQEKPYACEVCGKRFSVQCNFDRHKKIHSGERPFVCAQCGKAFIKKIDLQRHEQIHTGFKPFSCEHCTKSFLRKKNLIYHMMLHTEERPHVCIECNKGFIRSYYLNDHIKKHHSTPSL